MERAQRIRLNALLIDREEAFLCVHRSEKAIEAILGAPYPFPPPPDLPSIRKGARRKTNSSASSAASPPARARTLNKDEVSYRFEYLHEGEKQTDTTADRKVLQWILTGNHSWQLLKLETLHANGSVAEVLYSK